jgi:DNA-binding MarR family transcriptional regulator
MSKSVGAVSFYTHFKNLADNAVELRVLEMIEENPDVSERKITTHTGLASGLVHNVMKKVIAKGWVKVKQVSARRWLYYLTPDGFSEKGRLTINFLSATVKNYQKAQALVDGALDTLEREGRRMIVVVGVGELADIASTRIKAHARLTLQGRVSSIADVEENGYDIALICDRAEAQESNGRCRSLGTFGSSILSDT